MTIATWGDLLVKKEYKMTMPILQNRYYTLSVAGTMGRNSVVAMLGNHMVIGRLKNNTITFRIKDFTAEDTIVLICPEGGSITHAQLERGNKASDWRPAPEDLKARIDNAVNSLKNETIPALKDGLLNSSEKEAVKQSLNVVSADKKGIDMQYTTVYANTALTGTAKTNLNSAKIALNTAFSNLQSAINAVLGVGDGTRITTAQTTLVTTRLNEYGTALSTYNQRYEQAQDAISTEKKRLGEAYALAKAELAETQAKAHADGKVTAEEKRAIADAQAKLNEAKKYVDDLEVGGRNLLTGTSEEGKEVKTSSWPLGSWNPGLTTGEEYTFSFDIKSENATSLQNVFLNNSNNGFVPNVPVTKEWTRIHFTFKWKGGSYSGNEFAPHVYPRPNYVGTYTSRVKLEKGNRATDWTPAPEDVELAQNKKVYNPVRYIRDWIKGSSANTSNHWYEIMANDTNGTNVAQGKTVTTNGTASNLSVITNGLVGGTYSSTGTGKQYVEVDLGSVHYNIASVSIWHYHIDNRTYNETRTEVSEDRINWYPVFDSLTEGTYAETASGKTYPNTRARAEALISAYNMSQQLATSTSKVVINGGNITAGTVKSANSDSWINLDNGQFSFGKGNMVWNGSNLTVKGNIDAASINTGTLATSRIPNLSADKITAGTVKSANSDSWINLDNGQFSFGKGNMVWNGSNLTVKGNIDAASINTGTLATSRIPNLSASKITTGTLNAANVNITNLNVSSLVGNTSNFVQSAWNGINTNLTVNGSSLTYSHSNGSQTIMNASGLYHKEGGTTYSTHYLMEVGTATVNTYQMEITGGTLITLPSAFRGKPFKVVVSVADVLSYDLPGYSDLAIQRIVAILSKNSINHTNGTFRIFGYARMVNIWTGEVLHSPVQVQYTVIV